MYSVPGVNGPISYQGSTDTSEAELEGISQNSIMGNLAQQSAGINAAYDNTLSASREGVEAANIGRAKALGATVGGVGSTSGTGVQQAAGTKNATDEATIQNNRAKALFDAQTAADKLWSTTQTAMQTANANSDAGTPSASAAENVANRQSVADIVANVSGVLTGVTWQQFAATDPDTAAKITGILGSGKAASAEAELLWNAQQKIASPSTASDFKWVSDGNGNSQAFQYDPTTGQMTRRPDLDVASSTSAAANSQFGEVNLNGNLYLAPLDSKGKPIYDPTKPNFGLQPFTGTNAPDTTKTAAPLTPSEENSQTTFQQGQQMKTDLTSMSNAMQRYVATNHGGGAKDNYVSPQQWNEALAAWIAEGAGHDVATFVSNYKGYANTTDTNNSGQYQGL
jgi:hypothetical protein